MEDKFNWGFNKYDFSSIEDTLKTYFPIDNPGQYNEENINDFPGLERIEDILNDNFFIQKNYRERWGKFKKFLKQEFKKPVTETMVAFYPCYSGKIILKKEKNNLITYTKELHFYISLLGPYYTILALDASEITLEESYAEITGKEEKVKISYPAHHAITVSPYMEYEGPFLSLQKKIMEYFPSFRYIPFDIGLKSIPGISLFYTDSEGELRDSIFSALFRPDLIINKERRGDTHFGFDDWLKIKKLGKERIEEIKRKLLEKSLINKSEVTVHKVWKFKAVNRLPSTTVGGGLTFSMEPIQVLDLSDKNLATIISSYEEESYSLNYSINNNNEMHIDSFRNQINFRIASTSADELKLILKINLIVNENKKIEEDIVEMIFEAYN